MVPPLFRAMVGMVLYGMVYPVRLVRARATTSRRRVFEVTAMTAEQRAMLQRTKARLLTIEKRTVINDVASSALRGRLEQWCKEVVAASDGVQLGPSCEALRLIGCESAQLALVPQLISLLISPLLRWCAT